MGASSLSLVAAIQLQGEQHADETGGYPLSGV